MVDWLAINHGRLNRLLSVGISLSTQGHLVHAYCFFATPQSQTAAVVLLSVERATNRSESLFCNGFVVAQGINTLAFVVKTFSENMASLEGE